MSKYSKDLSNVQSGDIRLVQFEVGSDHPLYGKYVAAVITWAGRYSKLGFGVRAKTLEKFQWPEDPKGSFYYGWVKVEGHLETQNFPVKVWIARHKDGQAIMTFYKPVQRGDYWVDPMGCSVTLPKGYFPDVTYDGGPKEITYKAVL